MTKTMKLYAALVVNGERDSDFVPLEATLLPDLDLIHFENLKSIGPSTRPGVVEVVLYDKPEDGATAIMAVHGNQVVLLGESVG
jgi:hypothetical protein